MAEDRNDPNVERNAGTNVGDEGGQRQQTPGRNPSDDQAAGQRETGDRQNQDDLGRGEGGFDKGGQNR